MNRATGALRVVLAMKVRSDVSSWDKMSRTFFRQRTQPSRGSRAEDDQSSTAGDGGCAFWRRGVGSEGQQQQQAAGELRFCTPVLLNWHPKPWSEISEGEPIRDVLR